MNSKIVLAVVVLLLIGGGGAYLVMGKNKAATSPSVQTSQAPTASSSVFTSIKDALSKSLSLECSFKDDTGRQTKSYVKNGAVRVDFAGTKADDSGSMIMKDKKIYFWNSKSAFVMIVPDVSVTGVPSTTNTSGTNTSSNQGANTLAMLEKYKDSCKSAVVSDSLFTPPSDVKFTDYSAIMKPSVSGGAIPSLNPTQTQQYIQQYSQPTSSHNGY